MSEQQAELNFEDPELWEPGDLTPKRLLFCQFYAVDPNATQAYLKAYYPGIDKDHPEYKSKQRIAKVEGCKLLANPDVAKKIKQFLKDGMFKSQVSVEYVLSNAVEMVEIGMGRKDLNIITPKGKIKKGSVFDSKTAARGLKILMSHESISEQFRERIQVDDNTSLGAKMLEFRQASPKNDQGL